MKVVKHNFIVTQHATNDDTLVMDTHKNMRIKVEELTLPYITKPRLTHKMRHGREERFPKPLKYPSNLYNSPPSKIY